LSHLRNNIFKAADQFSCLFIFYRLKTDFMQAGSKSRNKSPLRFCRKKDKIEVEA
jgi:hypothetical protein